MSARNSSTVDAVGMKIGSKPKKIANVTVDTLLPTMMGNTIKVGTRRCE